MGDSRAPVVFIGHGSPMNIVRDNSFTRSLANLGEQLGKPKVVLVVSAHWLTRGETRVATSEAPATIHDFGGFPPELYRQRYPAPGAPASAKLLIESVRSISVRQDPEMGLDHGAWSVLLHMWPAADVPVFQMSIDWNQPPAWHLELGRELLALRDRGVLILGSGNIVHNLRRITPDENDPNVPDWASQFDVWAEQRLVERDDGALARYEEQGAASRIAVEMNDHYLPLLYSVGALAKQEKVRFTHTGFQNGSISMRCFVSEGVSMKLTHILVCAVAPVSMAFALAQKPAGKPTVNPAEIVEAVFAADPWTSEGRAERAKLFGELSALPPLEAGDIDKWKATCVKLWAKGRKLEKKNGQHYLWEKPAERGLYIVGGEEKRPKGLLIAMHGGGAGSGDAWSAHGPYQAVANDLGWLMICPEVLEKTEHGWTDAGSEEFVLQLVDAARRTWKIDTNHIFFSGHSMGGYGTWTLGAHHADRVAALAASAGAPTPITGPSGKYEDVEIGVIPSLRNVPMVVYQSDDDPNVPPAANDIATKLLGEAKKRWGGFEYEYWQVPGRQHGECPGGMEALLAKIAKRVRDPRPTKIVWQPALAWKQQFYWLWWTTPKKGAMVEADLDRAKNEIRVTCDQEPNGLEVLLDERLVDMAKDVVISLNGKEVFRGKATWSLATLVRTSQTGDEELCYAASVLLLP